MFFGVDLATLYHAAAGFGFLFFLFTALTARGAHSGGHGGHLSHGAVHGHVGGHAIGHGIGHGHAIGGGGHGHAIGGARIGGGGHAGGAAGHAGAGHTGAAGQTGAASHTGAAGQTGAAGHTGGVRAGGAAGHSGAAASESLQVQGATGQAVTGPMHVPHEVHRWSPVEVFLSICNPMRVASFTLFFGLFGRMAQLLLPWLGPVSLLFGIVSGIIGSNVVLALFGFVYSRFQSNSMSIVSDLIGHMAEVTVPIPEGKVGEITYIVESKRLTSAARAFNPSNSFKKGDKVMICNIEDAVSYIEPWDDAFIDPQFDNPQTINISDDIKIPESN